MLKFAETVAIILFCATLAAGSLFMMFQAYQSASLVAGNQTSFYFVGYVAIMIASALIAVASIYAAQINLIIPYQG